MAKYEHDLQGDFNDLLNILDSKILSGSASAVLRMVAITHTMMYAVLFVFTKDTV